MEIYNCLLGLKLKDALIKLKELDVEVNSIKITSQPREKITIFSENFRVLRLTEVENRKIDILVCKPFMEE